MYLKNYQQFNMAKDIFCSLSRTFANLPPSNNPTDFLIAYYSLLKEHPVLCHHIYFYALEAAYHKKSFRNEDLEVFFGQKFKIVDPYAINEGYSNMSTVSSLLMAEKIKDTGQFANHPWEIYSTPIKYQTPYYYAQQRTCAKAYHEESKLMTKNSNADGRVGAHIFDFKNTDGTSTVLTHFHFWAYEKANAGLETHFNSLLDTFKKRQNLHPMHNFLYSKLKKLMQDNTLSWSEKNSSWNKVIDTHLKVIPQDYPLPVIIQTTFTPWEPINPKKMLEKVFIRESTLETPKNARAAITGTCINFGPKYVKNAYIATEGAVCASEEKEDPYTVD